MPYNSTADLPESEVGQYDEFQRKIFLEAYQEAYEEYDHDENIALVTAHTAAKDARKKPEDYRKGSMAKNTMLRKPN